jgi:hypothetical protein
VASSAIAAPVKTKNAAPAQNAERTDRIFRDTTDPLFSNCERAKCRMILSFA